MHGAGWKPWCIRDIPVFWILLDHRSWQWSIVQNPHPLTMKPLLKPLFFGQALFRARYNWCRHCCLVWVCWTQWKDVWLKPLSVNVHAQLHPVPQGFAGRAYTLVGSVLQILWGLLSGWAGCPSSGHRRPVPSAGTGCRDRGSFLGPSTCCWYLCCSCWKMPWTPADWQACHQKWTAPVLLTESKMLWWRQ